MLLRLVLLQRLVLRSSSAFCKGGRLCHGQRCLVLVGKSIGAETRVLLGLVALAILVPGNYVLVCWGWIMLAVVVKGLTQWRNWL